MIDSVKNELFPGEQHVEDTKLDVKGLKELVNRFKALVKERTGKEFPDRPMGTTQRRHRRRLRFLDE